MLQFECLSDPKHKFTIDENNYTVAMLCNSNGADPEHIFLLVEGVNSFGKIMLTRYDCTPDPSDKSKIKVGIDQHTIDPQEAKKTFSDLLNNEAAFGPVWSIDVSQAEQLHKNILKSQTNPGNYNPLGNVALAPVVGDSVRATPPVLKDAIKTGTYAVTEVTTGPKAVTAVKVASTVLSSIPQSVYEPVTNAFFGFVGKKWGRNGRDIVENSFKSSGDNSFTWSRNMLLSIGDNVIREELPLKPLDLISSISSRHIIPNSDKDQKISSNRLSR